MFYLVRVVEGVPRAVHRLPASGVLGRGQDCDPRIDEDGLDLHQVGFECRGDRVMVRNLVDRPAMEIDGKPARMATLAAGSQLQIGSLRFFLAAGEAPAVEEAGPSPEAEMEALFYLSNRFDALSSREGLLGALIERLQHLFRAERAAVLLAAPGSTAFDPAFAKQPGPPSLRFRFSQTVAQRVLETGKAMLVMDTESSGELDQVDSIRAAAVRSVICARLETAERPLGVIYLDSHGVSRAFSEGDRDLLARFTANASQLLDHLREHDALRHDVSTLRALDRDRSRPAEELSSLVFSSDSMRWVMEQVRLVAGRDSTVLVLGESGTGKELVAQAIHRFSHRKDRCFVPVNIMALPESVVESELFGHEKGAFTGANERRAGRFEMAEGGTIFLDEIGELAMSMQVKLLRVLENRTIERIGSGKSTAIDVRIVAATNVDFARLIQEGRFREDLYYRLNVFSIHLPPLRERPEDIPSLVDYFVRLNARDIGRAPPAVSAEAMTLLRRYSWPGNVRELRNVIERASILERGEGITPRCLPIDLVRAPERPAPHPAAAPVPAPVPSPAAPPPAPAPGRLDQRLASQERDLIEACLRRHQGNISRAAEELGITRKTLYKRIREYGLPGFKE